MICVLALIVSGLLAVFSATHRRIAARAFDCVFRKVTLRPCDTGLDAELKGRITGPMLRANPRIGRHVLRYFELYSWILVLITLASIAGLVHGGVNYYLYGNCNGLAGGFCVIDPLTGGTSDIGAACPIDHGAPTTPEGFLITIPVFDAYSMGSGPRIVEFGCYVCEYSRKAEHDAQLLRDRNEARFTFLPVHIPGHAYSLETQTAAICAASVNRFWDVHTYLMSNEAGSYTLEELAHDLELGPSFVECTQNDGAREDREAIGALVTDGGIAGTPTFITASQTLAGPQRLRILRRHLS
jgi:hypothetical protein